MTTLIERTPIRKDEYIHPWASRQSGELSSVPTSLQNVAGPIREVADKKLPVKINGKTLSSEHLYALVDGLTNQSTDLTDSLLELRLAKLKNTLPDTFDPLARVVGGKLGKLKTEKGRRLFPRKSELYPAAVSLLTQLPFLTQTPLEFVPKPAPKEEVLTEKALEDAMTDIELSDTPNSVANQLQKPLRLGANGLIVNLKPTRRAESFNYDFTVPSSLLEILKSLKHRESEETLRKWLFNKCFSQESEEAISFFEALVNFSGFLDSATHLQLYKVPKVAGRKRPEILLQPFRSLLNSVRYVHTELYRVDTKQPILTRLRAIENLIQIRYAEVYGGAYQTSLYTFSPEALTPHPETFAELALSMVEAHIPNGQNAAESAAALIKLAESMKVDNLRPLIEKLGFRPELQKVLIEKAKKAGFIDDPETVLKALKSLKREAWVDAGETNFAEIIKPETTDLEIFVFTGTFGPFTKGHKDLLEKLVSYIESLPEKEKLNGDEKIFQRIILIIPITETSRISQYKKPPSQIGPIETRVSSILLQITGEFDPRKVLITTMLQPDPARTRSLEGSVSDTIRKLERKIIDDFDRAGWATEFERTIRYVYGPDEIQWKGSPRKITANQRRKVTQDGGVVVGRRGWLAALIRNHQDLSKMTGVETIILTPGTSHSGSTRLVGEIAESGNTRAVTAAARDYVLCHWSPEAIERRAQKYQSKNLSSLLQIPSISEIRQQLIEELEASLNQTNL